MAGEIIKIAGDYSDLYYPSKGNFVWQLLFIILLYVPSFALWYMNLRMVKTCIIRVHPNYNFETHELLVAKPKSEQEQSSLLTMKGTPGSKQEY